MEHPTFLSLLVPDDISEDDRDQLWMTVAEGSIPFISVADVTDCEDSKWRLVRLGDTSETRFNDELDTLRAVVARFHDAKIVNEYGEETVQEWGDYYLRNDTEIRTGVPTFEDQVEGYSLFRRNPYGRVVVFGGNLQWAVEQARLRVLEERTKIVGN